MKKLYLLLSFLFLFFPFKVFSATDVDLIFLLDGSSSIWSSDFQLQLEGLASAIEDPTIVPHDGTVSITVIQFAGVGEERVEVAPVIITEDNYSDVANQIRNISQIGGMTAFSGAINLAVNTIMNWPERGDRQAINLCTDGYPTDEDPDEGITAAENAISSGIDVIHSIGVGYGVDEDYLWDLVQPHYPGYPDPGQRPTEPPNIAEGENYGYVWLVTDFTEFADAVKEKIITEVHLGISPPTLPNTIAGLPYYQDLSVEGGEPPYTWGIDSGEFPPGLEIDTLTGEIIGAVTTGGTYDFVVGVTDSSDPPVHQSQGYTINADTPPYVPVERTGGKLLYVKDVTRDTDGNITQTGNLYLKDIETREEKPLTNYTGNFIIRNPSFSYNGSQIIYTSNVSGSWKIYLISSEGTVSSPDEGVVCENGYPHPYGALSPDGRFIAFVQEYNGRTQLWYYDREERKYSMIRDEKELIIRDIAFLNNDYLVFVGISQNIQDIYKISISGLSLTNLTNNSPPTPLYGRLMTTWRYTDSITFYDYINDITYNLNEIIYSKRNWDQFDYGKWDIYSFNADFRTEVNLTDTPDMNEYEPSYGNIADFWRGDMFYSASILAGPDVWRANYEWYDWYTVSNSLKDQWTGTTSTTENTGMIDFIPSTFFGISEKIITIPETRFFYIDGGNIYRGDYDENASNWNLIQPITTSATRTEISGAKNGGVIAYTGGTSPTYITKLNHNGTGEGIFASYTGVNLRNSFVSADGRWIIYVKEESGGTYGIYGKLTSGGTEQTILSGVAERIGEIALNDDMTKVVYSKEEVSGKYDIYIIDIITTATTITGSGTPVNLTNSPNADDRYPSFSPDGQLIIFVSDIWDNTSRIFTMDINGDGLTLVVGDEDGNPVNPAWPFFGPVNYDESNYYISYISDNPAAGTRTIKVASFPETDPTPDDGENLATLLYDTNISPSDDKYVWVIKREKGTIVGERRIPERIGSDLNFTYQIVIDTDEASLPSSFTLNEILPNTFNINSISIDGNLIPATDYSVFNNFPYSGLQTLKILFYSGYNYGIKDHLIEIEVQSSSTTGNYSISGNIKYLLNGFNREENISGNGKISVSPPFMPVDIYDQDDNAPDSSGNRVPNGNTEEPNGIIDDYDLLYAIDCWTIDKQLPGYGPKWPSDISNWDNIILAIIDIWASQGETGYYDPTGGGANAPVSNPQTEPGEYVFIGDKDSPGDNLPEIYAPDGATPGYPEMYWTQGKWANP